MSHILGYCIDTFQTVLKQFFLWNAACFKCKPVFLIRVEVCKQLLAALFLTNLLFRLDEVAIFQLEQL